jgi:hypothetical protein
MFLLQAYGNALAGEGSVPDFSKMCPPVLGFLNCVSLHTNAALNLQRTNLVVVTEFYRMDRLGGDMLRYVIAEDGKAINGIDDGTGVLGDPHRRTLSKTELRELRSTIEHMPNTNQYSWLHSIVIVSHRDGTNWVTHSHTRHRSDDDPPEVPALRKLLKIIGERPEANEVHHF